ncbi:vacuolar-processing enzyme [Thraustotheca clavata]|uniref:legumain n=1 Tax=Thraustotheca clavata TaxID=74557 RepID=A0A0A7CM90_9STRA|nr:secreted protein [Thraustotheca clavata]OQR90784.1 vacuolar-processing enzyme [Thraustotheca clavata]
MVRTFVLPLLLAAVAAAEHWAVIVVGSTGYWNYRHQADACHAYQVVRSHGIPESNIVLMMYDDVANSSSNPFPGQLFNKPTMHSSDAVDVYQNCHVDYRGDDVTPKKFLQVLLGDTAAGGKVLKSKSTDRVFVNFVDHGATGMVVFPSHNLYAKDLVETLKTMHERQLYKELVFYMEACESGSMFKDLLPENINAFVTTAANEKESSWGTYCPPVSDHIGTKLLGTCLGDLYSVNWMEDSDKSDLSKETLQEQYNRVKKLTDKSHVLEFGSPSMHDDPVGDFQSNTDHDGPTFSSADKSNNEPSKVDSSVNSRDIELITKFYQYLRSDSKDRTPLAHALMETIQQREMSDHVFRDIVRLTKSSSPTLTASDDPLNDSCLRHVNEIVEQHCGRYSDFGLQYVSHIVSLCNQGYDASIISAHAITACHRHSTKARVFAP